MAETKTVNWKEIAEKSENPEIKAKYELFKAETDESKQRSLRSIIVTLIKSEASNKAALTEALTKQAEAEPKEEQTPDAELTDVEKLKFWKDRLIVLENSRLKNETYAQRRELNRKIWQANEEIARLRESIRSAKRMAKLEEIKKSGRVSSLALKQAKVERLIQKGFSLTNITKHPEGVKKDELQKVIESGKFMAHIEEKHHGFTAMWERWKAKFLN